MDKMKTEILAFPRQFQKGFQQANGTKARKAGKVLFAGMGGSALAADLLAKYLPGLPILVHRDYGLPAWVDEDTLVFIVSYSGNTEETISSFQEAVRKGFDTIVITHGGKLADLARQKRVPLVTVPETIQPRVAVGYFFSSALAVLENSGIVKGKKSEVLQLAKRLESKNPSLESVGKAIASKVAGTIPLVYSSGSWWQVARTWKIKFNENAKIPAFWNVFPELNHNEMVGFTNPLAKFSFIFLQDAVDNERVKKRMRIMGSIMKQKRQKVLEVKISGSSTLEKMFSTMLLGDWTAYHTALRMGVDPIPVFMVEDFKKKMG